jgi:hypothetical protein
MYTRLHSLTPEAVSELVSLKGELTFSDAYGARRRQGANGPAGLSIYNYSKWFNWTHAQRETYRAQFPALQTKKAKQCWFLDIPPRTGFLDVMTYWVGKGGHCGKVLAYAMQEQTIEIAGHPITLQPGEGIHFCLSEVHELKTSASGQLWACMMVRTPVEQLL